MAPHEQPVFDEFLHSPMRLRVCGLLSNVDSMEFQVVRDTLQITDAHLSKTVRALAEGGYLTQTRRRSERRDDRRLLTWLSLTDEGKRSFIAHFAALQIIASGATPEPE
jgi:DNA-binding MarR family transcriptional regulator